MTTKGPMTLTWQPEPVTVCVCPVRVVFFLLSVDVLLNEVVAMSDFCTGFIV
jgi:hypothetical protein